MQPPATAGVHAQDLVLSSGRPLPENNYRTLHRIPKLFDNSVSPWLVSIFYQRRKEKPGYIFALWRKRPCGWPRALNT